MSLLHDKLRVHVEEGTGRHINKTGSLEQNGSLSKWSFFVVIVADTFNVSISAQRVVFLYSGKC